MVESRTAQFLSSELVKNMRARHGIRVIDVASKRAVEVQLRIPTGIFQVDNALAGGFPAGRVNTVYGHKSTGKSTILCRTIGQAQKMCANCWTGPKYDYETGEVTREHDCDDFREPVIVYLDVEGTFDKAWAASVGVDLDKLLLTIPDYAEQALDIAEALVRSLEVDIVVIDSIAFLTPTKEIEESSGKALQAEQARTVGRGTRKFVAALNYCDNKIGRRPTIFFTNQIRMKLGVMFGNPETQPGGYAPGFAASTEIRTSGGKYTMDKETGGPLCVDLKFKVEKNKSSGAKMEGEYRLLLADTTLQSKGTVSDEGAMLKEAIRVGYVERAGNGWSCLGEKFKNKALLEEKLMKEPLYRQRFRETLMSLLDVESGRRNQSG